MKSTPQIQANQLSGVHGAAVLFSANLPEAAIDELVEWVRLDPAAKDPRPWLMLLDLYSATNRRSAFELIAERYARAFPSARIRRWETLGPMGVANTIALKGVLTTHADLGDLQKGAGERKILAIDMGGVERIAYSFAAAFAATLKALNAGGKRVILMNVSEVHAVLLEIFDAPRYAVLMRRKGYVAEPQLLAA